MKAKIRYYESAPILKWGLVDMGGDTIALFPTRGMLDVYVTLHGITII